MKKVLIGVMGVVAIGQCAMAQSSVTIYGVIGMGPTYFKGGGQSQKRLDSSISLGSRLGFRGSEDLGNGLKAIFDLEMPLRVDSGEVPAPTFGREATVGLQSNTWGTVTLGRQTDFMADFGFYYAGSVLAEGAYGWHPGDYDRMSGQRYDNSIKFTSNKYGPMRFGALFSAGESIAGSGRSIGALYDDGPLKASLIYTATNKQVIDPRAQLGINSLNGVALTGPVTTEAVQVLGSGVSYQMDKITLAALHTRVKLKLPLASPSLPTTEVNAKYQITPVSFVAAGAAHSRMESNVWNKRYLTYDYMLSKRTDVYVSYTRLRVSEGNRAVLLALPPSTDRTATAVHLGLMHRF